MLPSSDLARLLSMRTIFRSVLLVIEILAWYAFGRYAWYKDHPDRHWSERHYLVTDETSHS